MPILAIILPYFTAHFCLFYFLCRDGTQSIAGFTVSCGSQTELSFPPRNVTQRSLGVRAIVGRVMGEVPSPALGAAQWLVEQGHLLVPQVQPMPLNVYPPVPNPLPPVAPTFNQASREEAQSEQPFPGPSPLMHLMNKEQGLDHSQ